MSVTNGFEGGDKGDPPTTDTGDTGGTGGEPGDVGTTGTRNGNGNGNGNDLPVTAEWYYREYGITTTQYNMIKYGALLYILSKAVK